MIGEVAAVLGALKALNDGINTIKQSAGHASDLQSIVGKWAGASEKYREEERKKAGRMSYKEALDMESAKRQLDNFDRQLKDICLMQGQGDLYTSIKKRMEDSRIAHAKEVARLRVQRKKLTEYIQLGLAGVFLWGLTMIIVWLILVATRV